jgi:hypothetical protein
MRPTYKHIFRQLKADLIGKDSHRGVTLTYAWLANQFGHFSLGFIPVLLVHLFLCRQQWDAPAFTAFAMISAFWLLFELYNFIWPLVSKKGSRHYPFTPAWGNIAYDTATDLVFFWIGAAAAWLFIDKSDVALFALGTLLILVAYPAYHWYTTKLIQQSAGYPFQFRLSQWFYPISEPARKAVKDFLKDPGHQHLLVFGAPGSGKTHISVGMANELSIRRRSCFYTSAIKLFGLFFDKPDFNAIWSWHNAEILVIDDINPADQGNHELISPEKFLQYIDSQVAENRREVLKEKTVIWVLGNGKDDARQRWRSFLENIGVAPENIRHLHLDQGRI